MVDDKDVIIGDQVIGEAHQIVGIEIHVIGKVHQTTEIEIHVIDKARQNAATELQETNKIHQIVDVHKMIGESDKVHQSHATVEGGVTAMVGTMTIGDVTIGKVHQIQGSMIVTVDKMERDVITDKEGLMIGDNKEHTDAHRAKDPTVSERAWG
jgi:hypothetical protein